jgi:hypothetical protein
MNTFITLRSKGFEGAIHDQEIQRLMHYLNNSQRKNIIRKIPEIQVGMDNLRFLIDDIQSTEVGTKQLAELVKVPATLLDRLQFSKDSETDSRLTKNEVWKHVFDYAKSQVDSKKTVSLRKLTYEDPYGNNNNIDHIISTRSEQYLDVPDLDLLRTVNNGVGDTETILRQFYVSELKSHYWFILPEFKYLYKGDENDASFGSLVVSNSEAKFSRVRIEAGFFRQVCSNGAIIWDKRMPSVDRIHRGNQQIGILKSIETRIKDIVSMFEDYMELVKQVAEIEIKDPIAYIKKVSKSLKFSEKVMESVLDAYMRSTTIRADSSLFAVSNAFSFLANEVSDQQLYEDLQKASGLILTAPKFQPKEVKEASEE